MYFLGIGSKDTMRCKLVCKTWRLYFKSIEIMFGADEKEEEKSYIPSLHIQRSQLSLVAAILYDICSQLKIVNVCQTINGRRITNW